MSGPGPIPAAFDRGEEYGRQQERLRTAAVEAECDRLREALREAREIIYHEFSGDPTEPWDFIDEALSEAGKR